VLDFQAAAEFLREVAGEFLDEVGHFLEVGEGPVGFEHGELRIVAARDALVAEVAVEFEDFGEAADQQALEEQLRRDAQVSGMPSALWCVSNGRAAAPPGMSWSIGVSTSRKPRSWRKRRISASISERVTKSVALSGIAHQVEVALAVFRLAVGEAVELVGHRPQRLGEHGEILHLHGGLAGAGEEGFALDADPVAAVEALPCGGLFLAEILDADVALDRAEHVAELEEHGLAHVAQRGDAAGDFHLLCLLEIWHATRRAWWRPRNARRRDRCRVRAVWRVSRGGRR
jgi:hypothetical protein